MDKESPDAQAGLRAGLSVAVGALIGSATVAVVTTFDVPKEAVAAWSGVALTLWRVAEVGYDIWRAKR